MVALFSNTTVVSMTNFANTFYLSTFLAFHGKVNPKNGGNAVFKIAICDDMPEELAQISQQLRRYISERKLDAEITEFSHPDILLLAAEQTSFDLYLLDVVMPMITGIGVGRELRGRHSTAQIVYLTASDEFAVSAFSVKAAHYLTKPFTAGDFDEAIDRAMENIQRSASKELTVRGEDGELRMVSVREIEYIESRDHAQEIHLKEEAITEQRRSLARLQEDLDALVPGQFIMPYKGLLVNLRAVVSIEQSSMTLRSGVSVPIRRGSCRQLQAQYTAFRFAKKEGML